MWIQAVTFWHDESFLNLETATSFNQVYFSQKLCDTSLQTILTIQTWALNGLAGAVVCLDMCLSRWLGGDWQRDKGKPQARLSIALSLLSYLWHLLMLAHMIQPESHFQNIKLCTTLLFIYWWKSEQLLIYFDSSYVIEWTIGSAAALDWFKLLN